MNSPTVADPHWPGEDTRLLLDWDTPDQVPGWGDLPIKTLDAELIRAALGVIQKRLARAGYTVTSFNIVPSTNGYHGKVQIEPPTSSHIEAVALQLVCGSDPLREACNIQRARVVDSGAVDPFWKKRWNVLYKPNPSRKKGP